MYTHKGETYAQFHEISHANETPTFQTTILNV
jgi:hypothetical protein